MTCRVIFNIFGLGLRNNFIKMDVKTGTKYTNNYNYYLQYLFRLSEKLAYWRGQRFLFVTNKYKDIKYNYEFG